MDEASVILAARRFMRSVNDISIPIPLEAFAEKVGAKLHSVNLPNGQSGYSGIINGKLKIVVNSNERLERQRFTVCHEIAHIHLRLPTNHEGKSDSDIYTKRPKNEVFCDLFAAESLLPSDFFKPLVDEAEISFSSLDRLAGAFGASLTATGSRFASLNQALCGFVLAEGGFVRFSSRSLPLREINGWIPYGFKVPPGSLAAQGKGLSPNERRPVDPTEWFDDWDRGGTLFEEARYLHQWNQTLSLLWFEDEQLSSKADKDSEEDTDAVCKELDGILPWPDRTKRR